MRRTLVFENVYHCDPDRIFRLAIDLDVLDVIARPLIFFDHLPSGPVRQGQIVDVAISVLGLPPGQPYCMRIAQCDRQARRLRSEETGLGLASMIHEVEVRPHVSGALQMDRIVLDGDWRTPFFAMMVRVLFAWRHLRRKRLLRRGGPNLPADDAPSRPPVP